MEKEFLNKYFENKKSLTKGVVNCSWNQTLSLGTEKDPNYLKTFSIYENCAEKIIASKFK
jgi:hypothetical protein